MMTESQFSFSTTGQSITYMEGDIQLSEDGRKELHILLVRQRQLLAQIPNWHYYGVVTGQIVSWMIINEKLPLGWSVSGVPQSSQVTSPQQLCTVANLFQVNSVPEGQQEEDVYQRREVSAGQEDLMQLLGNSQDLCQSDGNKGGEKEGPNKRLNDTLRLKRNAAISSSAEMVENEHPVTPREKLTRARIYDHLISFERRRLLQTKTPGHESQAIKEKEIFHYYCMQRNQCEFLGTDEEIIQAMKSNTDYENWKAMILIFESARRRSQNRQYVFQKEISESIKAKQIYDTLLKRFIEIKKKLNGNIIAGYSQICGLTEILEDISYFSQALTAQKCTKQVFTAASNLRKLYGTVFDFYSKYAYKEEPHLKLESVHMTNSVSPMKALHIAMCDMIREAAKWQEKFTSVLNASTKKPQGKVLRFVSKRIEKEPQLQARKASSSSSGEAVARSDSSRS